jgi:hypothetical protein
VDFIPVHGGDGDWHNVPVPWDDYIPLEATNHFFITTADLAQDHTILSQMDNLCIFH